MKMTAALLDEKESRFSLSGTCPHCNCASVFMPVTSIHSEPVYAGSKNPSLIVSYELWAAMRCQGCKKYVLGGAKRNNHVPLTVEYVAHYPLGGPKDDISADIPQDIANDFKEALRCLWVDAFNATVEMCRRAVETSCDQLGAPSGGIQDKIDWVHAQGKITLPLKEMAHKVRLGGNRGAHPSPRIIARDDAEAVIEFTTEYLDHVYVMPAKMAKFNFSKTATPSTTP